MKSVWSGGFSRMIFSILGLVIFVSMFSTLLTGLTTLGTTVALADFTAFATMLNIAPTLLWLAGIFGVAWGYQGGLRQLNSSGSDASGMIRMVIGVIEIILFITLFATVLTNLSTIYTTGSANANWIAFTTVIGISPTLLFLAGIFAGGYTAYKGFRAKKQAAAA